MNKFFVIPAKAGIQCIKMWMPAFAGMTILLCSLALALPLETPLPDPAQEEAAREIFRELRCVVCQSESIADSNAQVAADMRREIRAQIAAGKTHDEIMAYFTERYGDQVFMRTPFTFGTTALWLAPILLLLLGAGMVRYFFHNQRRKVR